MTDMNAYVPDVTDAIGEDPAPLQKRKPQISRETRNRIIELIAAGKSNREIREQLSLSSHNTVPYVKSTYKAEILRAQGRRIDGTPMKDSGHRNPPAAGEPPREPAPSVVRKEPAAPALTGIDLDRIVGLVKADQVMVSITIMPEMTRIDISPWRQKEV